MKLFGLKTELQISAVRIFNKDVCYTIFLAKKKTDIAIGICFSDFCINLEKVQGMSNWK